MERIQLVSRAVGRRWRVGLVVVVAVVCAAVGHLVLATPTYRATAAVLIQPNDVVATLVNPDAAVSPANAQRDLDTNARLITSEPVADAVRREVGVGRTTAALLDQVAVSGEQTSNLVTISVVDPSPELAARVASAFAEQAGAYRQRLVQDELDAAIEQGRRSLEDVTDPLVANAVRARLRDLSAVRAVQTGGLRLVSAAAVPSEPSAPRPVLVVTVALLLALVLGVLGALVVEHLDPRLRGSALAEHLGVPVLASLPPDPVAASRGIADLAAVLAARGHAVDGRWVVLVETSTATDDALGAADAGPLAERLSVDFAAGGRRALLVEAPGRRTSGPLPEGVLRVALLPSGRDDCPDLVQDPREIDARLEPAASGADVRLVAGAGLLPPRRSAALLALADVLVLVVRDRRTTRAEARELDRVLAHVADKVLGVVTVSGGAAARQPRIGTRDDVQRPRRRIRPRGELVAQR